MVLSNRAMNIFTDKRLVIAFIIGGVAIAILVYVSGGGLGWLAPFIVGLFCMCLLYGTESVSVTETHVVLAPLFFLKIRIPFATIQRVSSIEPLYPDIVIEFTDEKGSATKRYFSSLQYGKKQSADLIRSIKNRNQNIILDDKVQSLLREHV